MADDDLKNFTPTRSSNNSSPNSNTRPPRIKKLKLNSRARLAFAEIEMKGQTRGSLAMLSVIES